MAHCLPPTGLCQRQKNQGADEAQESVRGEPSLVIVPFIGNLDTISIPTTSSTPPLNRRRGRRRGITRSMIAPPSPVSRHPLTLYWGTHGRAREPHRPAPVSSMHGHTLSRPQSFCSSTLPIAILSKNTLLFIFETPQHRSFYCIQTCLTLALSKALLCRGIVLFVK